jgi:hypothetical protein
MLPHVVYFYLISLINQIPDFCGRPHRAKTDPKAVRNLPPLVDDATKDSLKTRTSSPFGRAWA